MKHLAQWLVDSVWQIADMIACSPQGLYIGREHLCGKEGEGGHKVSKPRPFGVLRPSGRGLTFVRQC